jgi:uncharacterized protein (DUF302 family)
MKRFIAWIVLFCVITTPVMAGSIFMTVTRQSAYRPALDDLTIAIVNHNYTIIKIQPVDKGLRHKGYETSDYKLLFFGDREQVDKVLAVSPEASAMLPLKIILYQKGNVVVASAPSMEMWKGIFGKTLNPMIDQWQRDVQDILREFAKQREL